MTESINLAGLRRLLMEHTPDDILDRYGDRLEEDARGFLDDWQTLDKDIEAIRDAMPPIPDFRLPPDFFGQSRRGRASPRGWNWSRLTEPFYLPAGTAHAIPRDRRQWLVAAATLMMLTLALTFILKMAKQPFSQTRSGQEASMETTILDCDGVLFDKIWTQDRQAALEAERGEPLLHQAAAEDCEEIVGKLLSKGDDIDAVNDLGETPLIVAAQNGNLATVVKLLERGADKTIPDNEGRTAAEYAGENGYAEVAEILAE